MRVAFMAFMLKYGLALGGGGARGFAHLGVLKVLEEAGFKPDIISGTSAGAIVGALYAKGLSSLEIFELRDDFNFFKVMHPDYPFDGLSSCEGLMNALNPLLKGVSFRDLRIKFLAVATNLRTGREEALSKGSVIDAVCASCSYPGIFNPFRAGRKLLVDGGIVSPAPVNVLKRLGVKRIVSVSLENLKLEVGNLNLLNLMSRMVDISVRELMDLQELNADIALRVPAQECNTVSTGKAGELFRLGERTARKFLPEIKKLLKY